MKRIICYEMENSLGKESSFLINNFLKDYKEGIDYTLTIINSFDKVPDDYDAVYIDAENIYKGNIEKTDLLFLDTKNLKKIYFYYQRKLTHEMFLIYAKKIHDDISILYNSNDLNEKKMFSDAIINGNIYINSKAFSIINNQKYLTKFSILNNLSLKNYEFMLKRNDSKNEAEVLKKMNISKSAYADQRDRIYKKINILEKKLNGSSNYDDELSLKNQKNSASFDREVFGPLCCDYSSYILILYYYNLFLEESNKR